MDRWVDIPTFQCLTLLQASFPKPLVMQPNSLKELAHGLFHKPRVGGIKPLYFCLRIALQDHYSHEITIPPTTKQVESKTNNRNWVHCRKCHFQYCHLCREACFGAWHFSEYGCKQLTTVTEDLALFTEEKRRKRSEGEAVVKTDNLS